MTKVTMVATDTVLVGGDNGGMKEAGDTFEVAQGRDQTRAENNGHLVADTPEADAFLAKLEKKNSARAAKEVAPAKRPFNPDKPPHKNNSDKVPKPAPKVETPKAPPAPLAKKSVMDKLRDKRKKAGSDLA